MPIRVAIAEDNALLRDGLARLISSTSGFELVGTSGAYDELLKRNEERAPGTAQIIAQRCAASGKDILLAWNPEFLREGFAIQDTMRGISDNNAFDTFERMNQKVEQIEAESEASTELGGELAGDTLQQKFKKLEGGTGSDLALAELKSKMGLGPAPERPYHPAYVPFAA